MKLTVSQVEGQSPIWGHPFPPSRSLKLESKQTTSSLGQRETTKGKRAAFSTVEVSFFRKEDVCTTYADEESAKMRVVSVVVGDGEKDEQFVMVCS